MKICIEPSDIKGIIEAPNSKSESIRALLISLFSENVIKINNLSNCDDVIYAQNAVENIKNGINEMNCGESAFLARTLPAIAAHFFDEFIIEGNGTLLNRNISKSYEVYNKIGIVTRNQNFPFKFKVDNLHSKIEMYDNSTSQILSGLLIALPFHNLDTIITFNDLKSKPYIDLTIKMLDNLGIKILIGQNKFQILSNQKILNKQIDVNSDASALAFLKACQLFQNDLEILFTENIHYNSDFQFLNEIIINPNISEFELVKVVNISDNPDIFPMIAILSARNIYPIHIIGISRLKYKESNRLNSILPILDAVQSKYEIDYENDYILIYPASHIPITININSFYDHRIVMAGILLSFAFNIKVCISNYSSISKSYPSLVQDFKKVGAKIYEYNRA